MLESDENGKINNALLHKTKILDEESTWIKNNISLALKDVVDEDFRVILQNLTS